MYGVPVGKASRVNVDVHSGDISSRSGGPAPPGIADLGPEAWRGDKAADAAGFVAVGVPVGTPTFVQAQAMARLAE